MSGLNKHTAKHKGKQSNMQSICPYNHTSQAYCSFCNGTPDFVIITLEDMHKIYMQTPGTPSAPPYDESECSSECETDLERCDAPCSAFPEHINPDPEIDIEVIDPGLRLIRVNATWNICPRCVCCGERCGDNKCEHCGADVM